MDLNLIKRIERSVARDGSQPIYVENLIKRIESP